MAKVYLIVVMIPTIVRVIMTRRYYDDIMVSSKLVKIVDFIQSTF